MLALQSSGRDRASTSATELPSPILSVALLLPAGGSQGFIFSLGGNNLLLGTLIATLTIDGMVHI